MKNLISLFLGFVLISGGAIADVEFTAPDFDFPFYQISFSCSLDREGLWLKEVRVNNEKWEEYTLFKEDKEVNTNNPLGKGDYLFKVDYAWKNDTEYHIQVFFQVPEDESQEAEEHVFSTKARSPKTKGILLGEEGFFRVFRMEEPAGLKRKNELIPVVFTVEKNLMENESFLVVEDERIINYQLLGVRENIPPEKASGDHPPTLTYKIVFPLDMKAGERKLVLIVRGPDKTQEKQGFVIESSGEGVGKTVKGERLLLEFHPKSGQVNSLQHVKERIKIYNEAGVIHWNPGIFIPGRAWDHAFNWTSAPHYKELSGIYLYINSRRGPFQRITEADLDVRYTLPVDAPYFISETRISVHKDLAVKAVRNDEMVLFKDLFDTLIYKNKRGKVMKKPLKENPDYPDGFVHKTSGECEWVGLLNTEKRYGFFSLRIDCVNSCHSASGKWLHKPGTYFYAPSSGKYVYWVRPLHYTWSEYQTRYLLTHVPEGSLFYEKNAYIVLPLNKGFEKELDILLKKLKNPIEVY